MKSQLTVTLDEFISSKDRNDLTYDKFDINDVDEKGNILMSRNILNDYIDEMMEYTVQLALTDKELRQYKYRPRLLANRIYGSPHYYYILLLLNAMCDEKQFDRQIINVIKPRIMFNIISDIYNSNSEMLRYYANKTNDIKRGIAE